VLQCVWGEILLSNPRNDEWGLSWRKGRV